MNVVRRSLCLGAWVALCAAISLALVGVPTLALWSASASVGISITSAEPAPQSAPPVFRAGKSKATIAGGTGPFEPIAHIDGDQVWLDFGVLAEGNSDNSPEVLLIDNPGRVAYALSASLSPEIRGVFSELSLEPAALFPGGTATLGMKLDTHGLAVGSYEGTLTVCDLFGTFSEEIPVRFEVVDASDRVGTPPPAGSSTAAPPAPVEPAGEVPGPDVPSQPGAAGEATATVGAPPAIPPEGPPATPVEPVTLLWSGPPKRCARAPAMRTRSSHALRA